MLRLDYCRACGTSVATANRQALTRCRCAGPARIPPRVMSWTTFCTLTVVWGAAMAVLAL